MNTILDTICKRKREEITTLKRSGIVTERTTLVRPFLASLQNNEPIGLIAELKKASPSKGLIRPEFNPEQLAAAYEQGGAHCMSVLTDRDFFQGDPRNLFLARFSASLPALRKDFIIDPLQVEESYRLEADAILLIAAILDQSLLKELYAMAREKNMDVLVEVHDENEMERVLQTDAELIGINNRNLKDFSVTLETTERLAQMVPAGKTLVSESGIYTRADIDRVKAAGASAVLVGESLMRQEDVSEAVKILLTGI
jgi:indole-3-glycerol phosphate synthase